MLDSDDRGADSFDASADGGDGVGDVEEDVGVVGDDQLEDLPVPGGEGFGVYEAFALFDEAVHFGVVVADEVEASLFVAVAVPDGVGVGDQREAPAQKHRFEIAGEDDRVEKGLPLHRPDLHPHADAQKLLLDDLSGVDAGFVAGVGHESEAQGVLRVVARFG